MAIERRRVEIANAGLVTSQKGVERLLFGDGALHVAKSGSAQAKLSNLNRRAANVAS